MSADTRVEFVERKYEKDSTFSENIVNKLLYSETRLIYITGDGAGGVGKSRLLEHVRTELAEKHPDKFFLSNCVDFSSRSISRYEQLLSELVAGQLSDELVNYSKAKWEFSLLVNQQRTNIREVNLKIEATLNAFHEDILHLSSKRKLVFFADTLEQLHDVSLMNSLLDMARLTNVCVICAGRPNAIILQRLKSLEFESAMVTLTPFTLSDSKKYLRNKLKDKELEPSVRMENRSEQMLDGMAKACKGYPLVMDIAIEYTTSELREKLKNEPNLSEDEFRRLVVKRFTDITESRNELFWNLTYFYPLNDKLLRKLIVRDQQSEKDFDKDLSEVRKHSFVRKIQFGMRRSNSILLQDNRGEVSNETLISLHDVLREWLEKYVLSKNGIETEIELDVQCNIAIDHYNQLSSNIIDQLRNIDLSYSERVDLEIQLRFSILSEAHAALLHSIPAESYKSLRRNIRYARSVTSYDLANTILDMVDDSNASELGWSQTQIGRWKILSGRLLFDGEQYEDAKVFFHRLLKNANSLTQEQNYLDDIDDVRHSIERYRAGIYHWLGQTYGKLGNTSERLSYMEKALTTYLQIPEKSPISVPKAHMFVGETHVLLGNHDVAYNSYRVALQILGEKNAVHISDPDKIRQIKHEIARVSDRIAFVEFLRDNFRAAQRYNKQAIDIWSTKGIGDVDGYNEAIVTKATIQRGQGKYDLAIESFKEVLESIPDSQMSLKVRTLRQLGQTIHYETQDRLSKQNSEHIQLRLEEAQQYLIRGLQLADDYNLSIELPQLHNQLSNVYLLMGDSDSAQKSNEKSLSKSREVHDRATEINAIVHKAEIAFSSGDCHTVNDLHETLTEMRSMNTYNFPQYFGIIERLKGECLMKEGDYDKAGLQIAKAVIEVDQYGGHDNYRVERELKKIIQYISDLEDDSPQNARIFVQSLRTGLENASAELNSFIDTFLIR